MSAVSVRYLVEDVAEAAAFYRDHLGFVIRTMPAPGFALLERSGLRLLLNRPGSGGAGQPDDAGTMPQPGGWNRFQIEVPDLEAAVRELTTAGVRLRTSVTDGAGGRQALVEDPSGNPIELFETRRDHVGSNA